MKSINKKLFALLGIFFISATAGIAQTPAATDVVKTVPSNIWMKIPDVLDNPMVWLFLLMSFVMLIVIYSLTRSIMLLTRKVEGNKAGEKVAEPVRIKTESGWSKLMKRLSGAVPVEQEVDVMLDHNYDGIRELDNQLPPWWKWGFYLTIVFAVVYLTYYHVAGSGKLMIGEYMDEMNQAEHERAERMKLSANNITDANVIAFTDAHELVEGKNIFDKFCVACHGNLGQGNVGPNLTDEFWIHGGGIKNVFHTITEGVPAKGMITWKTQLAPKQIQEVASFILTLKGTNPPGGKDPQGDKWIEEIKADSSAVLKKDSASGKATLMGKL